MADPKVAAFRRNRLDAVGTSAESVQNPRPEVEVPECLGQDDIISEWKGNRQPRIRKYTLRHHGVQSGEDRNTQRTGAEGALEQRSAKSKTKIRSDMEEKLLTKEKASVKAAKMSSCESTSLHEGDEFMRKVMKDLKPAVMVDLGDESDNSDCWEVAYTDEVLMWCVCDLPETVILSDSE